MSLTINDSFRQKVHKEQVDALYGSAITSILGTLLITVLIYFIFSTDTAPLYTSFYWVLLVGSFVVVRAGDTYLYFKNINSSLANQLFIYRFAMTSVLGAIGWGVMFWTYYPIVSQVNQFYLVLFTVSIVAFATTSLSYHLGTVLIFLMIIFLPMEARLLLDDSSLYSTLSILIPIFFISQIKGALEINKKYLENIRIQIEFKEKEKEYKNLKYAVDQHNIVSITDVEGSILYANDKASEVSQYSKEELKGVNHRILNSGEHSLAFWKNMWRTVGRGDVWRGKIKNVNKEGGSYWLDHSIVPFMNEQGDPDKFISISTDISKLKELETEHVIDKDDALIRAKVSQILQGQNSLKVRMEASLEAISYGVDLNFRDKLGIFLVPAGSNSLKLFIHRGHCDYTFAAKNKCFTHMRSLCARAIYSGRLVISDHCFLDSCGEAECKDKSHGHYIIPLVHNTKVLGILFIFTGAKPSRNQTRLDTLRFMGTLLGMAIANETIKRKLERAKKHALEMAQAKSDFLANMSHEIRTPMNGVLGMLDLLNDVSLDTQSRSYVETARGSAGMLLNVINDILDISKIESGKLHIERINFNLRKAIEDTTELLSKLAHEKGLELLTFIPPDIKTFVEGDMLRIQQVINNLVNNAIKFTHQGEVSIIISATKETDKAVTLLFEIKDSGIGIPTEKQEALFQAFTQADTSTSREYGGTGLGLAISKKLIEMMDGKIGFTSDVGKGSTFWFELPFSIVAKEAPEYGSLNKLRILTIDDNQTNCMIVNSYVESWGATSIIAHTAEEGLSLLVAAVRKEPFDVLLLDMQMPKMSGQEAAKEIRNHIALKNLKIILLSSMGLERGMNTDGLYDLMLNKPIRQSQLYNSIATVQNKSLLQVENTNSPEGESVEKYSLKDGEPLQGNILFVDDSKVNQFVGREFLTKLGLEFEIANNGQEALNARKEKHFDLILMDCQMPIMDGYEATQRIRSFENESCEDRIPIIALTANAMEGDREKCIDVGMDDYLTKPYTLDTLYESLSLTLQKLDSNHSIDKETDKETDKEKDKRTNSDEGVSILPANEEKMKASTTKSTFLHANDVKNNVHKIARLEGKVLLVDDSKVNQYVGKEILTKLGLTFEVAINGQEAVDARKAKEFDLILMDCQMPIMDGYAATREIRKYEKESGIDSIIIIALTANAMTGDRETCINSGMDDYLAKPYTAHDLFVVLSPWFETANDKVDV